jgi:hypothetical protein
MGASLLHQTQKVCQAGWTWVTIVFKPYQYDIVDSRNLYILNYTSILYIFKVFKHLPMQWKAIWMHPYSIKAMEVG